MKQKKVKKLNKDITPLPNTPEEEDFIDSHQSLNQKKIILAQHQHADIIVEIIRDILPRVPLVGKDEWETVKNAVTIDTSNNILINLVEYLSEIKKGKLTGK